MPGSCDILHDFPIAAPPARVFAVLESTAGLDAWWTLRSAGTPKPGGDYRFDFGPGYQWAGRLTRYEPGRAIEWELTASDDDWRGTRVGFDLTPDNGRTLVGFHHRGWSQANAHFRQTSYCWAMYLRLLRRHIELGELVPYDQRLAV